MKMNDHIVREKKPEKCLRATLVETDRVTEEKEEEEEEREYHFISHEHVLTFQL